MNRDYIIKRTREPALCDLEGVSYSPITKIDRVLDLGAGIGKVQFSRPTGRYNKSKFTIWTDRGGLSVPANAASVKKVLRRLRPEESAKIAELDQEIAALRRRRAELIELAWAKGHTVTVKELIERAEADRAGR